MTTHLVNVLSFGVVAVVVLAFLRSVFLASHSDEFDGSDGGDIEDGDGVFPGLADPDMPAGDARFARSQTPERRSAGRAVDDGLAWDVELAITRARDDTQLRQSWGGAHGGAGRPGSIIIVSGSSGASGYTADGLRIHLGRHSSRANAASAIMDNERAPETFPFPLDDQAIAVRRRRTTDDEARPRGTVWSEGTIPLHRRRRARSLSGVALHVLSTGMAHRQEHAVDIEGGLGGESALFSSTSKTFVHFVAQAGDGFAAAAEKDLGGCQQGVSLRPGTQTVEKLQHDHRPDGTADHHCRVQEKAMLWRGDERRGCRNGCGSQDCEGGHQHQEDVCGATVNQRYCICGATRSEGSLMGTLDDGRARGSRRSLGLPNAVGFISAEHAHAFSPARGVPISAHHSPTTSREGSGEGRYAQPRSRCPADMPHSESTGVRRDPVCCCCCTEEGSGAGGELRPPRACPHESLDTAVARCARQRHASTAREPACSPPSTTRQPSAIATSAPAPAVGSTDTATTSAPAPDLVSSAAAVSATSSPESRRPTLPLSPSSFVDEFVGFSPRVSSSPADAGVPASAPSLGSQHPAPLNPGGLNPGALNPGVLDPGAHELTAYPLPNRLRPSSSSGTRVNEAGRSADGQSASTNSVPSVERAVDHSISGIVTLSTIRRLASRIRGRLFADRGGGAGAGSVEGQASVGTTGANLASGLAGAPNSRPASWRSSGPSDRGSRRFHPQTLNRRRGSSKTCPVCLDVYQPLDEITVVTCGHAFHWECVRPWLRRNACCPCCRQNLNVLSAKASGPDAPQ